MKHGKNYLQYRLTKYDNQSLLNLPKEIELYGALIDLFESVYQAKCYLMYTKQIITDIHSVNMY